MSDDRTHLHRALGPTAQCPATQQLAQFVDGLLEEPSRTAVDSHLATCSHCQSEMRLLREFETTTLRPDESDAVAWISARLEQRAREITGSAPGTSPASLPWWKACFTAPALGRAALALGLVLALVSGSIYLRRASAPALNTAIDSGGEVVRSNAVLLVAPKGDLAQPPASFEWQAVPGAARYDVRVLEVDRTEVWKSSAAGASVPVPTLLTTKLQPAKTLLWQVVALDTSGKQLGSSDLEAFRLLPHSPQ